MKPERVIRFIVPTRELLERMAISPLPLGLREERTDLDFFRDVHFDTPIGDLRRKGATARLRIRKDGTRTLLVDVRERETEGAAVVRRYSEADVEGEDPQQIFSGTSEPARLLRALIDPVHLKPAFQLEVVRRLRTGYVERTPDASVRIAYDLVTVRQDDFASDMYEVEVRIHDTEPGHLAGLVEAFEGGFGVQMTLMPKSVRAQELLSRRELHALQHAVHAAREVAVITYDSGLIGLSRTDAGLVVPVAQGAGQEACRRALRQTFGRAQGQIRILGTSPGRGNRPALEVWLAMGVNGDTGDDASRVNWVSLDDALELAGSGMLRDARTLAALHVAARSGLQGSDTSVRPIAPAQQVAGGRQPQPEPLELAIGGAADAEKDVLDKKDVPPEHLLNMELSRLAFDERILVMAEDPRTPLLERVRFLSMFASRLDDFFMTRVAGFKDQVAAGSQRRTLDGLTPVEQLDAIAIRARQITARAYRLLCETLLPELRQHGIEILRWSELREEDRDYLRENYFTHARAVLTPLASDPSHPFPHVRNLRPAIAAIIRVPESQAERFAAIELPGELPRFAPLPGGRRFVPLEEVILGNLQTLYSGLEVVRAHTFRVTRNAQLQIDDDQIDLLEAIAEEVARRPFRPVVRLEVESTMPDDMRQLILRELQFEQPEYVSTLYEDDLYSAEWLVDLNALKQIGAVDEPALHYQPLDHEAPFPADRPLLDEIAEADRLVCFPHDSFEETVERFLAEAAEDPDVVSIRVTLYRTDPTSGVVRALARARELGKNAIALVELKASFDERRNIEWARSLEAAGIHVVFSPPKFKVHAKLALVVRREGEGLRNYMYIGTGNLNAATARAYTDVGLLTADHALGEEVNSVFNILTGYAAATEFRHLLVAPFNMRRRFAEMIEREIEHVRAGRGGHIRIQLNGLSDRRLIGELYRASQEGVRLDLAVREICCLRPGVPGLSENIRVTSLLGRLLQHARIFYFANGGEPEYFIGSTDWRPRNLSRRVEVAAPVRDPKHQQVLSRMLDSVIEAPDAWVLRPDGSFVRGSEVVAGTPRLQAIA